MGESTLNVVAMYGDHHVVEVRRILFELPGVEDVLASGSLRAVHVRFDDALIDSGAIQAALDAAGYTDDQTFPAESGVAAQFDAAPHAFRHTAAYDQVKSTVSFAQNVAYSGRPLWPCPGMGPVQADMYEEDIGHG